MARKNLLASVSSPDFQRADSEARSDYASRGASRSMMISIDEMAENSKKMIAGEAILSLNTSLIDGSFVSDRMEAGDEDYASLRDAIRDHGQTTPILVRPHPDIKGRYMIVFGHRRTRVAKELGIPVRAVVKNLEAISHIIAQGQENTARANLSFIEKALFGKKLIDMGQTKETVKATLTIDDTLLSRMLAVAETVPPPVIEAIGAAKNVGRDRWEELKKHMLNSEKLQFAVKVVGSDEFRNRDDRFNYLLSQLRTGRKPIQRSALRKAEAAFWASDDDMVAASSNNSGKTFSLSLKLKGAGEFGNYISSNLGAIYKAFKRSKALTEEED